MGTYSISEKKELLKIARQAIREFLETGERRYPDHSNPKYQEHRGAFVTLHRKGKLRGCIGHPLPVAPLLQSVVDNAVAAAFEDPRFSPLTREEFGEIDLEISILTQPLPVKSYRDIHLGRDGIIVGKGLNRGLLLPQVPVEQNWDLEEYISYGCLKAGLPMNEWQKGVKIETFQAEVFGEKDLRQDQNGT